MRTKTQARLPGERAPAADSAFHPRARRPLVLPSRETAPEGSVAATAVERRAGARFGSDLSGVPAVVELPAPGSGQAVPAPVREQFERVTGRPVNGARVHTGPASQRAADELEANAFTLGRDIHFAAGRFAPGTAAGDELLAHELTHTVQQRGAAPAAQLQLQVRDAEDPAEDEADAVAAAVLEDDRDSPAPPIAQRPPAVARQPKKPKPKPKAVPKPAKAKPITFTLFTTKFTASVDASNNVTVTKAGAKSDGWTFTRSGANTVTAERAVDHAEYVHARGTTEAFVERCTVTVPAGGPATHTTIVAELGSPPTMSIDLTGPKNAPRKSVTINATSVEQLDPAAVTMTFAPVDGDAIHLSVGGDAWVFTSLKPDKTAAGKSVPAVTGFFRAGYFTRYVDHGVPTFGVATPGLSDAARTKAMDDLTGPPTAASRQITTDEAAMFTTVSLIESDFAGVQTYDTGILSFGFSQWTVNADLPRLLLKADAVTFERYLGRYGLAVGTPVRQLDAFVHKFVGSKRNKLGVRNPSEGALFLNGNELVNKRLLAMANAQSTALTGFATRATAAKSDIDAAKPDLTSKDPAKKAAAVKATADAKKKVDALTALMAGLAGLPAHRDPGLQAAGLAKVATDGAAAAADLIANCQDSEVMRGEQWALRFEMFGQSAGGQDAEVAEVRANWTDVSAKSTHGAAFTRLLPNVRGKSALLSSYLNTHAAAAGIGRAVDLFKAKKKGAAAAAAAAAAKAKLSAPAVTVADWDAFPWKATDARWTTLWTSAAIEEFEAIAVVEVTRPTTDPKRRRDIIAKKFP